MLRVAVAEDDVYFRKELIKSLSMLEGINVDYSTGDGYDFFNALLKIKPDIAIMDIGMPGMSGIDVAKNIRSQLPDLEIIFITSYDEYIKEAINLYAADYIEKPLNAERLKQTLSRIKRRYFEVENMLQLKTEEGIRLINPYDICLIEAYGKRTIVYTSYGDFLTEISLKEIEKLLNKEAFFRTGRSFLVNVLKVSSIKSYNRTSFEISFKDVNYKAYLSKDLYQEFRKKIKDIYKS